MENFSSLYKRHLFSLFLVLFFGVGAGISVFYIAPTPDLFLEATIVASSPRSFEEELISAISAKDIPHMRQLASRKIGGEKLREETEICTDIRDLHSEKTSSGLWISYNCQDGGNVLHPSFGFLQTAPREEIFWGIAPEATLLSRDIRGEQKILRIQNSGILPIVLVGKWINASGNFVQILPASKREVARGEEFEIITDSSDSYEFFQNTELRYYLRIRER